MSDAVTHNPDKPNPDRPILPEVRLKTERRTSHPWIFQRMVEKPEQKIYNGSIVDVVDRSGTWVGRGIFNGHSRIALRILTTDVHEAVDLDFFRNKLKIAWQLRTESLQLPAVTNAFRVVHSEADGLSGLVVDRFDDLFVLEFFSAGMYRHRDSIMTALEELQPGSRFYYFTEEHIGKQESFVCKDAAPPPPSSIQEHGLTFRVTPGSKHKTGFFLDQRDNRRFLADLTAGKKVLDLCCNSGGFSIYSQALGQASEVIGVDLDEQVIELAKQNAKLNSATVRFIQADLFTWLRDVLPNGQSFDVVILDPAKLTRSREDVEFALKKYADMNRLAMQAVRPGGIFLTCSCTGLIKEPDFLEMLRRASWQVGRQLQIFRISGAGPDHPFFAHIPEGRYLKAVFARVF